MEKMDLLQALKEAFPGKVRELSDPFGESVIAVERESLRDLAGWLKRPDPGFSMLLDLTSVDYLAQDSCLEMVYTLFSLARRQRIRIKTRLPQDDLRVASLTPLWKNAHWLEREVYDLFGVSFEGHPDLRRIFLYDGFEGHPLRKDYPLRRRQPRIPLIKTT